MQCAHCTENIPAGVDIRLTGKDQEKAFCCNACKAVYQTIHQHQLTDYYQRRDQSVKPAVSAQDTFWLDNMDSQQWVNTTDDGSASSRLYIEGMHCTACAWLIEHYLLRLSGITHARVHYQHSYLDIRWQGTQYTLADIVQHIAGVGYRAWPFQADIVRERQLAENTALLKRIGISAILMMQIGMFSIALYAGDYLGIAAEHQQLLRTFSLIFSLPLLYFSALPFFVSAFYSVKSRHPDMNISISLAITGLYCSSIYSVVSRSGDIYFDSAAMFCLFVITARYIEKKSRTDMQPSQPVLPTLVTRITGNQQQRCAINTIAVGDMILVHEGDVIPLDGRVISGSSTVSEAFLNGESAPLRKQKGQPVFAGSQNHDGQLQVQVSCLQEQSLLNRINQLSQQAAEEKPRFISITDHIAARFTLIILTLTLATFVVWLNLDSQRAFWVALSVLVVSCPCALSLAAPTALSSVHFRLRKSGIYIRSIRVLETLNHISRVIFDKTGTLTEGRFSISETQLPGELNNAQCLSIAAALEKNSKHPLASAFQQEAIAAADTIQIHPGAGVQGTLQGNDYRMGSPAFCREWHPEAQAPDAQLWIGLCSAKNMLAWFRVNDKIRSNAAPLITRLKQRNLPVTMLSGDSSSAVQQTAQALGIDDYYPACSSEQKLAHLRHWQQNGDITLMLGDGINDAPVLAQSNVSATLFSASNWVKNSADMVLLNENLLDIDHAIQSAQQYRRVLIQNFIWAFTYNIIAIPFAMSGFVTPWMAALGMSLSSVIVVLNSRRLASSPKTTNPDQHNSASQWRYSGAH